MQEIIDVEYREVTALSEKTTEELCQGVNFYWEQMELLGRLGLEYAARAGKMLKVVKDRLKHGEWEDWAKQNLCFSLRKANYMMKLAEELGNENSIFSKNETVADIGITKVWALLGAPEEVRETIMENPDAQEMSAREFKEEIKRLKEEAKGYRQKENEDAGRIEDLDAQLQEATAHVKELEALLKEAAEKPGNEEELAEIKDKLRKAEEKLAKEKDDRKKDKESAEANLAAAAAEAEERAREKIEAQTQNKMETLQMQYENAMKEVDKLTKKLSNNQQEDMAVFKVKVNQLQTDFNTCMESIEKVAEQDPEQGGKMKAALSKIMNVMMGRV